VTALAQPNPLPQVPKRASAWKWAFRIFRWSTYLAVAITLVLLLHKAPAPAVEVSAQAAASADQKLQAVEQAVSQGQPATLRLDESELNSYLSSHLDLAGSSPVSPATTSNPSNTPDTPGAPTPADIEQARSSVRDVKVQLEGDRVKAYVVFDVHGKDMTLELEGRLGAQNGYLKFEPVSGHIGSLPIPQSSLETAVSHLMESPENREKLKLPAEIANLRIENGELVATYR
jgi:hypothetical protein